MTPTKLDFTSRAVYVRDAKRLDVEYERMALGEAVDAALENHHPGESPVIMANGLQLIGIDAIRAARAMQIPKRQ
jgi:hypothetical protein